MMSGLGVGRRGALLGGLAAVVGGAAPGGTEPDAANRHMPFRAELLAFLEETAWRCALPISADVSAQDCTTLHVVGMHPALWIAVRDDWAIDVGVDWDGECWDLLASFDVSAQPVVGGWENDLFMPEARVVRPSREEVWREDGFEMLLDWINTELVLATHVGLRGEPDRGTWVWLVRDGVILRSGRPLSKKATPTHLLQVRTL